MQPAEQDKTAQTLESRLRLMRIIWAMFLLAVGVYALVGYFAAPAGGAGRRDEAPAGWVLPLLVLVAVACVLTSIVAKRGFAGRAVAERRPELMQSGLILGVALCEAAALFGLVGLLVTGDSYAYVLFAIGAAGILLHFPSRDRLAATYYGPGGRAS